LHSREFSHKIKGIGHSSFTDEEVAKLQHSNSGNEAVNAKYLARYDPRSDRMKAPHNNNDLQHLRSWIKMKYIDKAWCERDAAVQNNVAATRTSSSFDSITPSSAASSANNTSWDAFGAAPAANFQVDFGNMNGTSPAPAVAPPAATPAMPAFQADFGAMNGTTATPHQPPAPAATSFQANFGNNFSQPTMVSMPQMPPPPPPQGQPQQQQQMQPPLPQQPQPGQGNFGQTPTGNHQQQQQPFQANFNQGMMQPPQQQHQQPVQQIPFQANFDQGQMMQQQPPAPLPAPDFQANFDQIPQNNNMMPSTQQQHQQSFQANFSQPPATMVPQQQQQQQQQPPQMNVGPAQTQTVQGSGGEKTTNQQASGMNFGQFSQQQQQQQQMVNDQQGGLNTTQQMPSFPHQPVSSMNVQSNSSKNISQIPENQSQQPKQELQPEAINPNAFTPADDKKDAFSAFDSLSLEPTNSRGGAKTPVREVSNYAAEKPKNLHFTKFKAGQQVVYTNGEGSFMALIKKVHYDDELHPYYTIALNGREKQTDDAHLSVPNETIQNQLGQPSNEPSAKLEETAAMLKNLSESQLLEVQEFIASLQSSAQPTPTPMPSMGMTQQEQNNNGMSYSQQQMGGMPHQQTAGMGGMPTQNHVAQQNSMPPPQTQTSFQQPNQMQGMTSNMGGMPTQMNTQQPMMQQPNPSPGMGQMSAQMQQSTPVAAQMYGYGQQPAMQQQQPTHVQGMGNTAMPQFTMQQQPMMPNTGNAQAQQQLPNPQIMQPMGVSQPYAPSPTMAPMAPSPNNLPPVEKEGNPFDVY